MEGTSQTYQRVSDLVFNSGIDFVTGVPDSEFKELIHELESADYTQKYLIATREDNAVSLAVGAYLAGKKPLVFMESSGVGNAIDALTSLVQTYEIPLVLFIAWAGYKGRDVKHHNMIGEPLVELLSSLNIQQIEVRLDKDSKTDLGNALIKANELAYETSNPVAVLGIPSKLGG